jgi:membrane-bound lytic murein transglycosylase B
MNLAFGIAFLWLGAAAFYVASHGLVASSPWGVFAALLEKIRESSATPAAQ